MAGVPAPPGQSARTTPGAQRAAQAPRAPRAQSIARTAAMCGQPCQRPDHSRCRGRCNAERRAAAARRAARFNDRSAETGSSAGAEGTGARPNRRGGCPVEAAGPVSVGMAGTLPSPPAPVSLQRPRHAGPAAGPTQRKHTYLTGRQTSGEIRYVATFSETDHNDVSRSGFKSSQKPQCSACGSSRPRNPLTLLQFEDGTASLNRLHKRAGTAIHMHG